MYKKRQKKQKRKITEESFIDEDVVPSVDAIYDSEEKESLDEDLIDEGEDEESEDVEAESDTEEVEKSPKRASNIDNIEEILFKLPIVDNPLVGDPKDVQEELDAIVISMQKRPNSKKNEALFNKIHLYMHSYLLNVVLKQFPFIRGYQTNDIYQETLIAVRFKAIPGFKKGKGMSFLNFSKMCIRRHLITMLNASQNRLKDKSINQSISLDSHYGTHDEDGSANTLANVIADTAETVDVKTESNEALKITRETLLKGLSEFEQIVLGEYLSNSSYKEIARNPEVIKHIKRSGSGRVSVKKIEKAVDNALLRIRKKAVSLKKHCGGDDLPIFIK